jgi:hypothetical protein
MQQARERVIVSAQVSPWERTELLRRAVEGDRSLSAEIRRAIREHLERDHYDDEGGTT